MIQKLIHQFTRKRHYWRNVGFDELSEIYTSMMIRSLGFSLMGIFVPIYLYTNGFNVQDIFLFFALVFLFRIPASYVIARLVGRIGPKHSIAVSTVILIGFLSMLLSYSMFSWPLVLLAFFFSIANGLFYIAYHTDFSKVKHVEHGGKELSYSFIFERAGSAAGPLIGGLLASFFIPELTIVVAILILLGSLIPLFLSNEPVKRHQHISFKGFKWRNYKRSYGALIGLNVEHVIAVTLWPLFVAIVVFQDNIYASVGFVVAIGTAMSIITARFFGAVVDNKKGLYVLRYGAFTYAALQLIKPFIRTATGVIAINSMSEPTALALRLPITKGFYDEGDSVEGFRIVYFSVFEIVVAAGKSSLFLLLYFSAFYIDSVLLLQLSFVVAALGSLATLTQRFPALKKV